MADGINAATKYIVTHRPESLEWGPVEGIGPDIVEGIRRIKSQEGPDIILWGSSTLTSMLLEHGLADEVLLIVYPVVLGTGKRFFAEEPRGLAFELVSTKAFPSGSVLSSLQDRGTFEDCIVDSVEMKDVLRPLEAVWKIESARPYLCNLRC